MLRRIFEPRREEIAQEVGKGCIMIFVTCTLHQILLG
jgi:hypothetical protein